MNWEDYSKMMDEKVADAKSNYDKAEKEYLQEKAKYKAILKEKEQFLDFRMSKLS